MPTAQPTLWSRSTNTPWKKALIAVGMLALIALIPYGIAEYSYQLRMQKLVHALQEFDQKALKSRNSVVTLEPRAGDHCTHVIDAVTAIDTGPCPIAAASWLVPVAKGQEGTFITSILHEAGLSPGRITSWQGGGTQDGVGIYFEVHPGTGDGKEPYSLNSDKEWVIVNINAREW